MASIKKVRPAYRNGVSLNHHCLLLHRCNFPICAFGQQRPSDHWTGVRDERPSRSNTSLAGMNRQAPALPDRQRIRIHQKLPEDSVAGVVVWDRLWFIMSSICLTHLWRERNDAVFRGKQTAALRSAEHFWEVGIWHLNAVAKREHRGPDTAVAGAIMHTCIDLFTLEPRDGLIHSEDSYDQPPILELLYWLGSFQTSCA